MTQGIDTAAIKREMAFLKKNPHFEERPATVAQFLGDRYLNIEERVRPAVRQMLVHIIGPKIDPQRITAYPLAMITGGIGIGKTTIASIVLPYLAHWVLCLKDPQGFFGLLPGTRIAFMQMSTSGKQAEEVVFGDVEARINYSEWFQKHPRDQKWKKQIRLPKNIWILPGDSAETTFEGYNILGGILDEADSHKLTKDKDYADVGYDAISNRITSRFGDRGFLLVIGQMKKSSGFASRKFKEFERNPAAYARRLSIWESLGDDHFRKLAGLNKNEPVPKFHYDIKRKQIVPDGAADVLYKSENILAIPKLYLPDFENAPEKALKDLAGIPPAVGDPFISLTNRIEEATQRWIDHYGSEPPVDPQRRIAKWFTAQDSLPRVAHIDLAYADGGDALGFAMGHVREMVEIDGERKPHIVIDMLYRETAPPGGEIFIANTRHMLYDLRDTRKFRIKRVTMDGFQSQDGLQQLRKRRFEADYLSMDKQLLPYFDLRDAIYEGRIELPPYLVYYRREDNKLIDIAYKELSELEDHGDVGKVDHPVHGSKDVADAIAGVVFTLIGERRFQNRSTGAAQASQRPDPSTVGSDFMNHPAYKGDGALVAPLPPRMPRGQIR